MGVDSRNHLFAPGLSLGWRGGFRARSTETTTLATPGTWVGSSLIQITETNNRGRKVQGAVLALVVRQRNTNLSVIVDFDSV